MFTPIINRKIPPVAGIDLEHALTYVSEEGLQLEWFYTSFTWPRTFYRKGSRPELERLLEKTVLPEMTETETIRAFLKIFDTGMPHYARLGTGGAGDRGMTEEALIASGEGWCNEQARVFLALTQIAGIPSRLVFAEIDNVGGHVLSEVFTGGKWVLVDQTEAYIFTSGDGTFVNVMDIRNDRALWEEADSLYKIRLMENRQRAKCIAFWDKWVPYSLVDHPLELFDKVGYCNYFIR